MKVPSLVVIKHFDNDTAQLGYSGFDLQCSFKAINRSDALYDVEWVIDGDVFRTETLQSVAESSIVNLTLSGSDLLSNASTVEKVCS